jgi:hypothetical protein
LNLCCADRKNEGSRSLRLATGRHPGESE